MNNVSNEQLKELREELYKIEDNILSIESNGHTDTSKLPAIAIAIRRVALALPVVPEFIDGKEDVYDPAFEAENKF